MFAISILLLGETGNKIINFQDYNAQTIGIVLLWIAAFLTLYQLRGLSHEVIEV